MYNLREGRKRALYVGLAGLAAIPVIGPIGLAAALLGGVGVEAAALIDPERPYKVEKRERKESAPLTPEDKKRYDERADKIVDGIETAGRLGKSGIRALGGLAKYAGKKVIKPIGYRKRRQERYNEGESQEREISRGYGRLIEAIEKGADRLHQATSREVYESQKQEISEKATQEIIGESLQSGGQRVRELSSRVGGKIVYETRRRLGMEVGVTTYEDPEESPTDPQESELSQKTAPGRTRSGKRLNILSQDEIDSLFEYAEAETEEGDASLAKALKGTSRKFGPEDPAKEQGRSKTYEDLNREVETLGRRAKDYETLSPEKKNTF